MSRFWESLHVRLGLILGLMLAVLWLSLWLGSTRIANDTADRDIDARLRTTAISLARISVEKGVSATPSTAAEVVGSGGGGGDNLLYFEVRRADSRVLMRSRDFPPGLGDTRPGFSDPQTTGQRWRVYTWVDHTTHLTVRVAAHYQARLERSADLRARFSLPLLWLLPALLGIAAFTLWRGLAPLRTIERALARQQPHDLRPLGMDDRDVPRELRHLLTTLDALLTRVADLLDRQRLFAAGAAHELRTPIAACRSQAELAERSHDPEQIRHAARRIRQSIDRMTALIAQLLLLARADSQEILAQSHSVALDERLTAAIERARPSAEAAGVELVWNCSELPLTVVGDRELLDCVLDNLLANAIGVCPAQAMVSATLERTEHGVQLSVYDEGPGVDESESERLFDPFYRGDTRVRSGTGLGLSITRTIVANHKGRITVTGQPRGGAVARVWLPAMPVEAPS